MKSILAISPPKWPYRICNLDSIHCCRLPNDEASHKRVLADIYFYLDDIRIHIEVYMHAV